MKLHFHIVLFLSIVSLQFAISQPHGQIVGKVVDARTGEPLDNASILFISTTMGATADGKGDYLVSDVPPGIYSILATVIGYDRDTVHSIAVRPNEVDTVNFNLYSCGTRQARLDIAKGIVQIAILGLTISSIPEEVENKIAEKYGFKYNHNDFVGGCVEGYTITVNEYLDKVNAKGWRAKYDQERDSLLQQYSRSHSNK